MNNRRDGFGVINWGAARGGATGGINYGLPSGSASGVGSPSGGASGSGGSGDAQGTYDYYDYIPSWPADSPFGGASGGAGGYYQEPSLIDKALGVASGINSAFFLGGADSPQDAINRASGAAANVGIGAALGGGGVLLLVGLGILAVVILKK